MKYIALIVAMLSGWVINQYLLEGAPGAYVSVLFAYHFFLIFLVGFMDWSEGFNLPLNKALGVHLGVLVFLLAFVAMRSYIPGWGLISLIVPAIGFLEVEWIFGKRDETDVVPALPNSASSQDYAEFVHYLKQPNRQFAKPGRPVQEEYGYWLAQRTKTRAGNQPTQGAANNSQTQ